MPSFGKIGKGRKKTKNSKNGSSNADSEDVLIKNENGTPSREHGNGTSRRNETSNRGVVGNGTTKDGQQQQQPWKLPGIGNIPKLQSRGSPGKWGGATTTTADSATATGGKVVPDWTKTPPRSLKKATMSESSLPTAPATATNPSEPPNSKLPDIPDIPVEPRAAEPRPPQGNPPSPVLAFKSSSCKKQSPLTKSKVYHPKSASDQAAPSTPPRKSSLSDSGRAAGVCGQEDSPPTITITTTTTTTGGTPPPVVDSDPSIVAQFRPLPPTPTLSEQEDEGEGEGEGEGREGWRDGPVSQYPGVSSPPTMEQSPEAQQEGETDYASIEDTNGAVKMNPSPEADTETPAGEDGDPKAAESNKTDTLDEQNSPAASENNQTLSSSSLNEANSHQDGGEAAEEVRDYTIGEVVSTYAYALPVCVRILQGYCSDTTEVNISTDDIYNIHSVQHIKKVLVKDENGMTHRISLDAPLKIGVIYNPRGDYEESLNGYNFKNISEVTSMPVLPKLISSTQAVGSAEEKNSVSEGEIFVVKNVNRSMFKGKKGLKVFSLTTRSNKVLFDDCPGHFSTKPSLVRVDLPELLDVVGDVFPSSAVIYPTTDDVSRMSSSDFPGKVSQMMGISETPMVTQSPVITHTLSN